MILPTGPHACALRKEGKLLLKQSPASLLYMYLAVEHRFVREL